VLKDAPLEDIEAAGGAALREAIRRIRCGELAMEAGYDGEFGNVKVFTDEERKALSGSHRPATELPPTQIRHHRLQRCGQ
jgi:hypothetical protein